MKIQITPVNISIRINQDDPLNKFTWLLYLSLDTEMSFNLEQVYDYLWSSKLNTENELFEYLQKHKNWEYIKELKSFNPELFISEMTDTIGLDNLIFITNKMVDKFIDKDINKNSKLLKFIEPVNKETINHFYKHFKSYFDTKTEYHIERYKYLIREVIEDLKGNRPYNEAFRIEKNIIVPYMLNNNKL